MNLARNPFLFQRHRIRGFLAFVVLMSTAIAVQAKDDRKAAQGLFDRASTLAVSKDYESAKILYLRAAKVDATWEQPYVKAALCERKLGNYRAAEKVYARGLKTFKEHPDLLFGLAETLRLRGQRKAARQKFLDYLTVEQRKGKEKMVVYATAQVTKLKKATGGTSIMKTIAPSGESEPDESAKKASPRRRRRSKNKAEKNVTEAGMPAEKSSATESQEPQKSGQSAKAAKPPEADNGNAPEKPLNTGAETDAAEKTAKKSGNESSVTSEKVASAREPKPAPVVAANPVPQQSPASSGAAADTVYVLSADVGDGVGVNLRELFALSLHKELESAKGLVLKEEKDGRSALLQQGKTKCSPEPSCLAQAVGADAVLQPYLEKSPDGVAVRLDLKDVNGDKVIARRKTNFVEGSDLTFQTFLHDELSELLAEYALSHGAVKKKSRRVAGATDGKTSERTAPKSPSAEARRDVLNAPPKAPKRRLVDADEPEDSDSGDINYGKHIWRWGFVGLGVTVLAVGAAADFLLPTSANYELDAPDFILPGAVGGALLLGVVGFLVNPFSWFE